MRRFVFAFVLIVCILIVSCINGGERKTTAGTGEPDDEIITESMSTGDWEVCTYIDKFGDSTGEQYLLLTGIGQFSNSATTNSRLMALLYVDSVRWYFKFFEYGNLLVRDEGFFTLSSKDSKGTVRDWRMYNPESGIIILDDLDKKYNAAKYDAAEDDFKHMLFEGGDITFAAEVGTYSKSRYRFKMNFDGYENALKLIQGGQVDSK